MIYCDASLVVALVAQEVHSDAAERWLRAQPPAELAASPWVMTEVASALALKHRLGQLDRQARSAASRLAERLVNSFIVFDVERRHFQAAGERYVTAQPKGLRAGDALHLAIVVAHGLRLATLDRNLREAALHLGVDAPDLLG